MDAAIRQRQIDGAAPFRSRSSGVSAAFVEFHRVAAALNQDRKQRAGRTRADDADGTSLDVPWRNASDKASTAANTSLYEL